MGEMEGRVQSGRGKFVPVTDIVERIAWYCLYLMEQIDSNVEMNYGDKFNSFKPTITHHEKKYFIEIFYNTEEGGFNVRFKQDKVHFFHSENDVISYCLNAIEKHILGFKNYTDFSVKDLKDTMERENYRLTDPGWNV